MAGTASDTSLGSGSSELQPGTVTTQNERFERVTQARAVTTNSSATLRSLTPMPPSRALSSPRPGSAAARRGSPRPSSSPTTGRRTSTSGIPKSIHCPKVTGATPGTRDGAIPARTRFGGVPTRVPMPPTDAP